MIRGFYADRAGHTVQLFRLAVRLDQANQLIGLLTDIGTQMLKDSESNALDDDAVDLLYGNLYNLYEES